MKPAQMTLEEAMALLEAVAANYMGKLQDHKALQEALLAVKKALNPHGKPAKEEKEHGKPEKEDRPHGKPVAEAPVEVPAV